MGDRQLKFNEAAALLWNRFEISGGKAEAAVWEAIASREVHRAWTEAAIINQERRAPRIEGNSFDIRFAANQAAAYERGKWRLRLLTEVESVRFKDEIIAGNITLSEADLLNWAQRNPPGKSKVTAAAAAKINVPKNAPIFAAGAFRFSAPMRLLGMFAHEKRRTPHASYKSR